MVVWRKAGAFVEGLGVLASDDWASASLASEPQAESGSLELEGLESGSPESESRPESGSLESGPKALGGQASELVSA